eukprot:TRINITY_DN67424_c0_g2_i8.p1 TRINITY_DN67424_c0_g2~~TRINITY_DN67424_c0_g2_i8.p1  ORF type:complete len:267 (+),score=15.79 TRINITY_DN67424_c0_g2_i8:34-834(+)
MADIEALVVGFDESTPPNSAKRTKKWRPSKNPVLQISAQCAENAAPRVLPFDVMEILLAFVGFADTRKNVVPVCKAWLSAGLANDTWRQFFLTEFSAKPADSDDEVGISLKTMGESSPAPTPRTDHTMQIALNFRGRHFYSLFKRKYKLQRESSIILRGTTKEVYWSYSCPLSWYDLTPIQGESPDAARLCSACNTKVTQYKLSEFHKLFNKAKGTKTEFPPTCASISLDPDVGDAAAGRRKMGMRRGKIAMRDPTPTQAAMDRYA